MAWPSRCRSASSTARAASRSRGRGATAAPAVRGAQASHRPQGRVRVLLVAEVAQEVQHPAAVRLGEAQHLVELLLLVLALPHVGGPPARAPHPGRVPLHHRPAVDPELVESALHLLGAEAGAPGQLGDRTRLGRERAEQPLEDLRLGVVALEEVLVGAAVGPGVEEDGARGLPVAPGAADLLVVALDASTASRCGRRCARRACRCPCRRRSWPRSRRARRRGTPSGRARARGAAMPAW